MNTGRYVFAQMVDFIPKFKFEQLVKKYGGDYRTRDFTSYCHLLHLMFGQITACKSLRDICLCLKAHQGILYHLGLHHTVNESSLSRANDRRDYRIFEELGHVLIEKARRQYAADNIDYMYSQEYDLLAVDSTTISCSIKLASWALGKYSRGGVKMHTVIDLRGSIPLNIWITDSRMHDSNFLDQLTHSPGSIFIMDKAYVDFRALYRIHRYGSFFVTRAKSTMRYEVCETNYNIDESSGLRGDQIIRLTGYRSSKLYPENLRLVTFHDDVKDENLEFISNNLDVTALEIAYIYRDRWSIETFFKWIKQNLTIKSLWGYSENAVKIHLWAAICTFLTVALVKARYKSPYSVTEVATILGVYAMAKADIGELLTIPDDLKPDQNFNELSLFDNF